MTPPERDQASREKGKVAWERPTLTLLGDVKDLIHASGKAGAHADGDTAGPASAFRPDGPGPAVLVNRTPAGDRRSSPGAVEPPGAGSATPRRGAMLRAG